MRACVRMCVCACVRRVRACVRVTRSVFLIVLLNCVDGAAALVDFFCPQQDAGTSNQTVPRTVYRFVSLVSGMDWLCPSYSEVLARQIKQYHGQLTTELVASHVVPIVQTGNLQVINILSLYFEHSLRSHF